MDASKNFDLTTTRAAFIDEAVSRKALFIEQPYELYSKDNQEAWKKLWQRLKPLWEGYASNKFLEGLERLALNQDAIPHLREVNKILGPLTGFKARPVSGYVPGYIFFDSLKERIFPTTITIRDSQTLDYLPEPDIFTMSQGMFRCIPTLCLLRFWSSLDRWLLRRKSALVLLGIRRLESRKLKVSCSPSLDASGSPSNLA
jgi:phenylalanine-4-hydroxylase